MDIKKAVFIDAYAATFGNITQSCQVIGISRRTYYDWMQDDAQFKAQLEAIEPLEIKLDFVENKLVKKIEEGDTACLIFVAKTLGKKRGYVERTELEQTGEMTIKIIRDATT